MVYLYIEDDQFFKQIFLGMRGIKFIRPTGCAAGCLRINK